MLDKAIKLWRDVPPTLRGQILCAHALLLLGCLWQALSYPMVQCVLVVEVLVIDLVTATFYRPPETDRNIANWFKTAGIALFVLLFLLLTYGIAAKQAGNAGMPLEISIRSLRAIDARELAWALAYVVVRTGFNGFDARRTRDPRGTWMVQSVAFGASTLVAMLFMVFATLFVGVPLGMLGVRIGWHVDIDRVLGAIMVCLRCFTALVAGAIRDSIQADAHRPPAG